MPQLTEEDRLRIGQLFIDYYRKLVLFAESIIKDEKAAENIMLDVLLKVWPKIKEEKLKPGDEIEAYLITSTRYKCYDYLKEKGRTIFMGDDFLPTNDDENI